MKRAVSCSETEVFFSMTTSLKREIINIQSFLQIVPYLQDTGALRAQEDIRYLKHLLFYEKFSVSLEYQILVFLSLFRQTFLIFHNFIVTLLVLYLHFTQILQILRIMYIANYIANGCSMHCKHLRAFFHVHTRRIQQERS